MIIRFSGTRQQLIDELKATAASRRVQLRTHINLGEIARLAGEADGIETAISWLEGWTPEPEPDTVVAAFGGTGSGGGGASVTGTGGSSSSGGGGRGGDCTVATFSGQAGSGTSAGGGARPPGQQCPGCGRDLYLTHTVQVVHQDGTAVCGPVLSRPPEGKTWFDVPPHQRPEEWADGIEVIE